jgi:hypothetical protein
VYGELYWPLGSDDVPITGPAAITVIEYVCKAVAPSESLTLTMNENAPAAVGAPVMIPDDILRDKPGGSAEPGAGAHVQLLYGGTPLLATNCCCG